jgi:dUTP pyrophosphatase
MIKFEYIDGFTENDFALPVRGTQGSAGYDLCVSQDMWIPGVKDTEGKNYPSTLLPTGVKAIFPDNVVALVYPRSSLFGKHSLTLTNSVGVIDSDYQKEIFLSVINWDYGFVLPKGTKIAQVVFTQFLKTDDDVSNGNRDGGFGSTG